MWNLQPRDFRYISDPPSSREFPLLNALISLHVSISFLENILISWNLVSKFCKRSLFRMISLMWTVKVPMSTRSRKGSKHPKLGSTQVIFTKWFEIFSKKQPVWLSIRLKQVVCTIVHWRSRRSGQTATQWVRRSNNFQFYFKITTSSPQSVFDEFGINIWTGIEFLALGKTNEEEQSTRPKRQCAKRFDSFIGVDTIVLLFYWFCLLLH